MLTVDPGGALAGGNHRPAAGAEDRRGAAERRPDREPAAGKAARRQRAIELRDARRHLLRGAMRDWRGIGKPLLEDRAQGGEIGGGWGCGHGCRVRLSRPGVGEGGSKYPEETPKARMAPAT